MKNLFDKYKSLIVYFLAAGSGVIVQFLVASFCIRYFSFEFEKALFWGFISSIPVGFVLSKIFAFESKSSGNTTREIFKFLLVLIISGFITVKGSSYTLQFLTSVFGHVKTLIPIINVEFNPIGTFSHFFGMGLSFIFNFFTHKKFTFVETGLYDKLKGIKEPKS